MLENNTEFPTQRHASEDRGIREMQGIPWLKLTLWQ